METMQTKTDQQIKAEIDSHRAGRSLGKIIMYAGMGLAVLFFAQMQDYLELGVGTRINTPGTMDGNWRWRLKKGQLTHELAQKIATIARLYGRGRQD